MQMVPIYTQAHKNQKKKKFLKQVIDLRDNRKMQSCIWYHKLGDIYDNKCSSNCGGNYINPVVASNSTTKQFYSNTNQCAWMTAKISSLLQEKQAAHKNNNKEKTKKIQNQIKNQIKDAKIQYNDKMLSKMSSNIKESHQIHV